MTRTLRFLNSIDNGTTVAAAPPPEAVAMESDFVVILAALLCALICVVGLIAVARCAWLRRGSGAGGSPTRALANKGLKKKVLQSLPKFTYVDGSPQKWVATSECAICLAEFADGDEIRVLPQCGHGFHMACIDTWLGSHSSCPSCRQILAVTTRCQKCGQFPAVGGGAGAGASTGTTSGGGVGEPELKSREDGNVSSGGSNYNNSNAFSANPHNHHTLDNNYLP